MDTEGREPGREDAKMIKIFCPNQHTKGPVVMELVGHSWSYKNDKPTKLLYQFKCSKCGAVLRTELPIIYYKEGKK